MKIASIHQPHFWPWLGFLRKMKESNIFVFLDTASYTKGSYQNRNRIQIDGKPGWLSIPIETAGKLGQSSYDTKVCLSSKEWWFSHWGLIKHNYPDADRDTLQQIKDFYFNNRYERLVEWCAGSIDLLRKVYGIKTKIVYASNLDATGSGSQRLYNICKAVGADTYLSGPSGRDYLDEKMFKDITVKYITWKPPSNYSALHYWLKGEHNAVL